MSFTRCECHAAGVDVNRRKIMSYISLTLRSQRFVTVRVPTCRSCGRQLGWRAGRT